MTLEIFGIPNVTITGDMTGCYVMDVKKASGGNQHASHAFHKA